MTARERALLLLLIITGVAGNYFSIPLFFGVDFVFGSIPVLAIVCLFGTAWGAVAAVLASSYMYFLWGHPYAIIIFTAEAVFVGLTRRRAPSNLALLDGVFWLTVGLPLIWLFYSVALNLDSTVTQLILLKQALNGIFNALVASLLVFHLPLRKWAAPTGQQTSLPFSHTLSNLLVAFLFLPSFVFLAMYGRDAFDHTETEVKNRLISSSTDIDRHVSAWQTQYLNAVEQAARVAGQVGIRPSPDLRHDLEIIQKAFPDLHNMYVADASGTTVAFYPSVNERGESTTGINFADRDYFKKLKATGRPVISKAFLGRGGVFVPIVTISAPIIENGSFRGIALGAVNLRSVGTLLEQHTKGSDLELTVIDGSGRVVATTAKRLKPLQPFSPLGDKDIELLGNSVYQSFPENESLPEMLRWKQSHYIRLSPIGRDVRWSLVSVVPARPYVESLQKIYIRGLAFTFLLVVAALLLAQAFSRIITSPLSRLAELTTELPNKLTTGWNAVWPSSSTREIRSLVENLKSMARILRDNFHELSGSKDAIEKQAQTLRELNTTLCEEVGQRTQAQARAKESERTLFTLMSNLPGMAYRCRNDADWMMEFVSEGSFALTGYYPSELVRNQKVSYASLIHADDQAKVWDDVQKALEQKTPFTLIYRIRTADGQLKWVWEQGLGVFAAGGSLSALEGFITDITERKQAEERSRKYLQRLHALHEIDGAINSTLDLDTVLNILLEKIDVYLLPGSAASVRLWDEEKGTLEPVSCRNLNKNEWKGRRINTPAGLSRRVFESRAPVIIPDARNDPALEDPEHFTRNGLVSYLGVPLPAKGALLGVLSLYTRERREFSDEEIGFLTTLADQASIAIHKAQLYQKAQEQAVALERTSRVKDEFLSMVSHELRTPLNVIIGYTAMLDDGVFGTVVEEQRKALNHVMTQTKEMLSMVTAILYATQIGSGVIKIDPTEVNVSECLNELKSNYDVLDKPVAIRWDCPRQLPTITTDKEKLKHILQNLVENAVKFTDQGSVTVSVCHRLGSIEFKVADTGVGIPRDKIPVIFNMFRQLDSSATRRHGGVGVGLYVVKQFTELLGGKAHVESELGKGSSFTISIPCDGVRRRDFEALQNPEGIAVKADKAALPSRTVRL